VPWLPKAPRSAGFPNIRSDAAILIFP